MKKTLAAFAAAATIATAIAAAPTSADARCYGCAVGAGVLGGFVAGAIVGNAIANAQPVGMSAASPHATADDPRAYIDLERVEEERQRECVGRYEGYLRRLGVLSDELAAEIKGEAAEAMRRGIAQAEAEQPADPSLVFEHAYVDPPPALAQELADLRRILDG